MPWSAKAQELLKSQYAAVGAAARAAFPKSLDSMKQAIARLGGDDARTLATVEAEFRSRHEAAQQFVAAYGRYYWPVTCLDNFKLAPFHLLATEGRVHCGPNHQWLMVTLAKVCSFDPQFLLPTAHRVVEIADQSQVADAIRWWQELTEAGGEGMVVKPLEFVAKSKLGLLQPAVKCRGREYLRIIYGPDYTSEQDLTSLRKRGLAAKRSLALREFALGIEALERFVRREPLRRVHECVFGVLALQSEPVDPRL